MTITTTIRTLVAVTAATGTLASSAFATGEPKNTLPFTRPIVGHGLTLVATLKHGSGTIAPLGEPKNVAPFTHR
jgi:hypothetical protein